MIMTIRKFRKANNMTGHFGKVNVNPKGLDRLMSLREVRKG